MSSKSPWFVILVVLGLISSCTKKAPETILERKPDTLLTAESGMATSIANQDTPTPEPSATPLPDVRVHSGEKALFNGDWETALGEYQAALEEASDPKLIAEALLGSARSYFLSNDDSAAIGLLEELIQNYPDASNAATAHFELAQAYVRQERYQEAIEQYSRFLEKKPGAIDAYLLALRADSAFNAGDFSAAADDYQAAINTPSVLDEIDLRMKLARTYTLAGDYPGALALYDDISLRTQDDFTRALIDLRKGQIYTEMGQIEAAHAAFLDAVNNYPKSYDSYSALVSLVDAGVDVDGLQRGIIDYYAGMYGPAAASSGYLSPEEACRPGDSTLLLWAHTLRTR